MNDLIQVGIIGGADHTTGELIRLLLNHPAAEIQWVYHTSLAGNLLTDVHCGLYGETDLIYTSELDFDGVDVVFCCLDHLQSAAFFTEHYIPADLRIIDLSPCYRMPGEDNDFVYGLPELNHLQLIGAQHIANPGHFATAIGLALLPLASQGWLDSDLSVHTIAATSGDGSRSAMATFSTTLSSYIGIDKAFRHPQLAEVRYQVQKLQPTFDGDIDFLAYRGNFARGLFTTIQLHSETSEDDIEAAYQDYYAESAFTQYCCQPIDLKEVVNTNKCLLHVEKSDDRILVCSALDNLLKGGAGQAVQNMNLMFDLEETAGLRLKPVAF
ncbi:N-acetyl-gamma-glutamyl-phosphate reductase [gut metagenome]|uniref:N-acetyl-gamma-glutamyl-phosphate reductase n=1 Tax=gut metagenome TaxID=749906 RepID=J9F9Y9_9ZZZZ